MNLAVGELTVLLGANNAGKSTLLKALEFFFDGTPLSEDDVYGDLADEEISVQVAFDQINDADRAVLQKYAQGDQVVLTRTWRRGESKFTGTANRYPPFDPIKEATGREPARLWRELRGRSPELGLPEATTKDAVAQAMVTWEMEHSDECTQTSGEDASSFLGYSSVGKSRLDECFRFVFVPGLRDATSEAMERKGTLLSRLLTAVADQRAQANESLAALEVETRERYDQLVEASHGPTLTALAERLSENMRRYVPEAAITLSPIAAEFRIGQPLVELRGGEAKNLTDLGRQGHGFQRTFIMTVLEYLANTAVGEKEDGGRPTLFLAIEEPELYQHPPRARHFAETLKALSSPEGSVQVCYATHSPYFVAPADFDTLRIFRKRTLEEAAPTTQISAASVPQITARLPENRRDQPERVLARTLNETFREAFFSRSVLLVEGPTDAAVFAAAARRLDQSLVARGVVAVHVGKGAIPIAYAILRSLDIPTYVVFDADSEASDSPSCDACGRSGRQDRTAAAASNRAILRALGLEVEDFPTAGAREEWACFETDIEGAIPALTTTAADIANRYGWGAKSPEAYADAIAEIAADDLPSTVNEVVARVLAMAAASPAD